MLTAASGHWYTMRLRRDHNFVPEGSRLLVVYWRQRDWTNIIGVRRQTTTREPPEKRRYLGGFTIKLNQAKKTYSNLLLRLEATSGNRCQSQTGLFSTIPAESTQAISSPAANELTTCSDTVKCRKLTTSIIESCCIRGTGRTGYRVLFQTRCTLRRADAFWTALCISCNNQVNCKIRAASELSLI